MFEDFTPSSILTVSDFGKLAIDDVGIYLIARIFQVEGSLLGWNRQDYLELSLSDRLHLL